MVSEKSKQALTVVTVALAIFMTNLDTSIVNIALPSLAETFNADTDGISRIILFYLLAMVSFLLVFGKISDLKGSEKIFTLGYLVFTVASALCALSPTLELLNLFRFIQGIGSAMLLATWGAITVKYLPPGIRGRAFGFVTVFGGVGMAIGAPVGGFLIEYLSWKWIFLINVPVGILAIIMIRFILTKKHEPIRNKEPFDLAGSVLSFVGLLCFFLVLNSGQDWGWLSWRSLFTLGISLVCFTLFYFQERRCAAPILNLKVLQNKHLYFGYSTTLIMMIILAGFNFLFPFFFDFVRQLPSDKTGMLLMTFPLITILVSPLSGYISDKSSARLASIAALIAVVIASVIFATFGIYTSYLIVIASFVIFGIGLALFFTANTSLIMSHATRGVEGMFSALIAAITYLGSAIGINLFEFAFSMNFPNAGGKMVIDKLPATTLVEGFFHASVFGIGIAIIGLITTFISREKKIIA